MKNVRYVEQAPAIDDYFPLFLTTGWNEEYKFNKVDVLKSISNSWFSLSAYVDLDLIGFGRVISDGVQHAFVVDIIVDPEYQRRGIGSRILERLVGKCKESHIRDVQLFCAQDKLGFCLKHGFESKPTLATGMQLKYTPEEG